MTSTYDPSAKTSFTRSHRKEGKCFFNSLSIISLADTPDASGGRMPLRIEARFYGTGSQNTCCLWIHSAPLYTQGSGKAGGYGYHRPSAAFEAAANAAGFTFSEGVSGVGESAVREALLAMARTLKIKRPAITEAYQ